MADTGAASKNTKSKAGTKAKAAANEARKGAQGVANEAKAAASQVSRDATEAAQDLAASASEQIQEAAAERKQQAADRVLRIAEAVDNAGSELDREIPFVGEYVHRAADEIETVGRTVRDRDVGELVDVAQDFARRQPALFAGVVGLAGFAAVRFVMASASRSASSGGQLQLTDRSGGASYGGGQGGTSGGRGEAGLRAALAAAESDPHPSGDPGGVDPEAPTLGLGDDETKGS